MDEGDNSEPFWCSERGHFLPTMFPLLPSLWSGGGPPPTVSWRKVLSLKALWPHSWPITQHPVATVPVTIPGQSGAWPSLSSKRLHAQSGLETQRSIKRKKETPPGAVNTLPPDHGMR